MLLWPLAFPRPLALALALTTELLRTFNCAALGVTVLQGCGISLLEAVAAWVVVTASATSD